MSIKSYQQLFNTLKESFNDLSIMPLYEHAQKQWNTILQKAILFYHDKALFSEYCLNDVLEEERQDLLQLVLTFSNEGYALRYEWDQLLFPCVNRHHCLLQALIDYELLSKSEITYVHSLLHSVLGVFQLKGVHKEYGYVILEDIFNHHTYRVYDEVLLLDALVSDHYDYLFVRLLPLQTEWMLGSFEARVPFAIVDNWKKEHFNHKKEAYDALWSLINE